jgi:hypothetical protein
MVHGEEDFTVRSKAFVDLMYIKSVLLKDPTVAACVPISIEHVVDINHKQILGVALKTPTFAQCIPTSIENDAIAYELANNWFRVAIKDATGVTFTTDMTDDWTRQLGLVDLSRVLGAALSHSNPVIARLTDGSAFIDPRDVSDRAARLMGVVYGSLDKLQQQATTKELLVQIAHQGVIKDPTQIRALTSSDIVTAYGSQTQALLQRASTYDLIVQIRHNGVEKDPTQIRALTSASDSVEAKQATASNLNANVFTKHDNKTYKTAVFDASASGNLVAAVADKVIKLHALTIQAQGTVVVNLNNGSGGSSLMEWSFQAREGAVVPMAPAPAYWAKTSVNTALYVTLSAAVVVTITAIYSDDDTS